MNVPPREGLANGVASLRRQGGRRGGRGDAHAGAWTPPKLVMVDYDPLPAITDVRAAMQPDAPQLWDGAPGNIGAYARYGDAAGTDAAFAKAAHVTHLTMHNQRLVANPIEPRAAHRATSRTAARAVHAEPDADRHAPEPHRGRVRHRREGSAHRRRRHRRRFRPQGGLVARGSGDVLRRAASSAGRCAGAPNVQEDFLAAHQGRAQSFDAALALDADGRILGDAHAAHRRVRRGADGSDDVHSDHPQPQGR